MLRTSSRTFVRCVECRLARGKPTIEVMPRLGQLVVHVLVVAIRQGGVRFVGEAETARPLVEVREVLERKLVRDATLVVTERLVDQILESVEPHAAGNEAAITLLTVDLERDTAAQKVLDGALHLRVVRVFGEHLMGAARRKVEAVLTSEVSTAGEHRGEVHETASGLRVEGLSELTRYSVETGTRPLAVPGPVEKVSDRPERVVHRGLTELLDCRLPASSLLSEVLKDGVALRLRISHSYLASF